MSTIRYKILLVVTIFFFECSGCHHLIYSTSGDLAKPDEKSVLLTIAEHNLPDTIVGIEKIDQQYFSEIVNFPKKQFKITPGDHTISYYYLKTSSPFTGFNNLDSGGSHNAFRAIRREKIFSPKDFNISFNAKAGHAYILKSFAQLDDSEKDNIDIIDLLTMINDVTEGKNVAWKSMGKGAFKKEIRLQTGLELKRETENVPAEVNSVRNQKIETVDVCGNDYCEHDEIHSDCPEDCFPLDMRPDNLSYDERVVYLNFVYKGQKSGIYFAANREVYRELASLPRTMISMSHENKKFTKRDFIMAKLDNKLQRENLLPLVQKIKSLTPDVNKQARIAISLVQNIPYDFPEVRTLDNVSRDKYPYEVLWEHRGICSEKADLLLFMLRELGFGTATLIYKEENHRTVGIKCQDAYDVGDSGYCYVEVTGPKIITDSLPKDKGVGNLTDFEVIKISDGFELKGVEEEFTDRNLYYELIKKTKAQNGTLDKKDYNIYTAILNKYGLEKD